MSFDICENTIEDLIQKKLKEIEETENVKILHAVESGSRAWGFASPDSDYDVRFIYVRPMEYYLGLQTKKDVIDWELNETLDINGWDLCKVLQHFHKSNATMYEWANSPIVYYTSTAWEQVKQLADNYFSCKAAMYHYYGTANKNYFEYLTDEMVRYKKYFYVLRPILACKWIETKKCPPPVLFQNLAEEILEEEMKETVANLVQLKMQMTEAEKGKRIESLNEYIVENLTHFKKIVDAMKDDRNSDWTALNELFFKILKEEWFGLRSN